MNNNDELSFEELEQVGMPSFIDLNEFMTAFEKGDMQTVVDMGASLMASPALNNRQKEEIAKLMDQAKHVLNNKEETKGFGL